MVSAMLMLSSAVGMIPTQQDVNVLPAMYNVDCVSIHAQQCCLLACKYHHLSLADGSLAHLLVSDMLS